ncbi:MAG TPA: discoidin domain-containing protein [Acidimicrobiales bacterium]|nr:discoidin domain-containing protein [Acidimicrobiales bacterium]
MRALPTRPVAGLLVLVALAATACGGDDGDDGAAAASGGDGEVRPFAEVQASDMTFEADPSDPTRGIFRVTTSEPMICAIVWGRDDSLGQLNNSLDMNGTGIEQHDVLLPDVEPSTEYHFVVQGTTADGTLYRSETGTFRIERESPASAGARDDADNLALGAEIVDVSSEFSESFAAEGAVDGDTATEWATSGDGDEGSITLDLGSDQAIGGVEFVTRSMADGSSVTDTYTVTVDDADTLGPFPAGTVADPRLTELDTHGRRLRFDVETSTGGNVGAVEIRVYGPTS